MKVIKDKNLLELCEIYGLNPNDFLFSTGIIDPHEKSIESLKSKIERKVNIEGKKDFTLYQMPDLARCAILVDSYEDVPKLLMTLKDNMPFLTGDLSIKSSGYRGIHLHYPIDGIQTEIQISTPEAWRCKRITDSVYDRFRDFNIEKYVSYLKLLYEKTQEAKFRKNVEPTNIELIETYRKLHSQLKNDRNQIKKEYFQKQRDEALEHSAFKEMHSNNGFIKVQDTIRGLLAGYTATVDYPKNYSDEQLKLAHILKQPIPKTALMVVDMDGIVPLVQEAYKISGELQYKLMHTVETASKYFDKNSPLLLNPEFKEIILTTTQLQENYFLQLSSKTSNEFIDKYIKQFSDQAFDLEVETIRHAIEQDMLGNSPDNILNSMLEKNIYNENYSQQKLLEKLIAREGREKFNIELLEKLIS